MQCFLGSNSLRDFHNPHNYITPLVELPSALNPYLESHGVHLYAKLLYMNPLLNVKSIPAWYLIQDSLSHNNSIIQFIENSSGNTAYSLAVYAKVLANAKMRAIVSSEVLPGKLNLLNLFDIDIDIHQEPICPDPSDPASGIVKARELGKQDGWSNPGQYDNVINPQAHYEVTGPQIYEQMPLIDTFVSSLGTTGTAVGTSRYLKEKNKYIQSIGVVRKENNAIPGPRTLGLLEHVDFDWEGTIDATISVDTYTAYKYSKILCEYGILGGPSSGMQYWASLEYVKKHLDIIKQPKHLVFVCCDTALPYLSEYNAILSGKSFKNSIISSQDLNTKIKNNEDLFIIDLRQYQSFQEYHIPGSHHIPFIHIDEYFELNFNKDRVYIIVCGYSSKSDVVVQYILSLGGKAYGLEGGIVARSNMGYALHKNMSCVRK